MLEAFPTVLTGCDLCVKAESRLHPRLFLVAAAGAAATAAKSVVSAAGQCHDAAKSALLEEA